MTKILIVEDDKSLREIYGIRLAAEGYKIITAGDGEEALAATVREKPDLILADVMMPKISGFDMLDILKSTPETQNIKVIVLTALSSEDQKNRGNSLGAEKFLVKSQAGIEDVINAVHEVLGDTETIETLRGTEINNAPENKIKNIELEAEPTKIGVEPIIPENETMALEIESAMPESEPAMPENEPATSQMISRLGEIENINSFILGNKVNSKQSDAIDSMGELRDPAPESFSIANFSDKALASLDNLNMDSQLDAGKNAIDIGDVKDSEASASESNNVFAYSDSEIETPLNMSRQLRTPEEEAHLKKILGEALNDLDTTENNKSAIFSVKPESKPKNGFMSYFGKKTKGNENAEEKRTETE